MRDKYDRCALHLACEGGNLETVQYLVGKRNCDIGKLIYISENLNGIVVC